MSAQLKKLYTPEEYLAFERASEDKHEYLNGELFLVRAAAKTGVAPQMVGASFRHVRLVGNCFVAMRPSAQKQGCGVYTNDLRIKTPSGLYAYPDILVVCNKPEFLDNEFDTLLNPIAIIEVLSDSTQHYDRTKKFDHYRSIPTLRDYILIEQNVLRVEHFMRIDNPQSPPEQTLWGFRGFTHSADTITLTGTDISVELSEIYDTIDLS